MVQSGTHYEGSNLQNLQMSGIGIGGRFSTLLSCCSLGPLKGYYIMKMFTNLNNCLSIIIKFLDKFKLKYVFRLEFVIIDFDYVSIWSKFQLILFVFCHVITLILFCPEQMKIHLYPK